MNDKIIKLHEGDNLPFMKEIPDNTVDLIYCDILYGTGRKFKDYQDLKPKREIIEKHYIPRIKEMYRILRDTGSIYLQMDSKISHWVRIIMDGIFGYNNFQNEIRWKRSRGVKNMNKFSDVIDIILFYSKTEKYNFTPQYGDLSQSSVKRYNKKNKDGQRYMLTNIQSKKNFRFNKDIRVLNDKQYYSKQNLGWDWTQDTLDQRVKNGYVFEETDSGKDISYRRYLADSKGAMINTLWDKIELIVTVADKYDTQKPKALLERIIKTSSNEGDIVADFYMGSGTTAEVCCDLGRYFIGCDISPRAIEITKERVK